MILDKVTKHKKVQYIDIVNTDCDFYEPTGFADWHKMPFCILSSLTRLLCESSITSLCIHCISHIPQNLLWGTAVKELIIWGLIEEEEEEEDLYDDATSILCPPSIEYIQTSLDMISSVSALNLRNGSTASTSVVSLGLDIKMYTFSTLSQDPEEEYAMDQLDVIEKAAKIICEVYPNLKDLEIRVLYRMLLRLRSC